MNSATSMDAQRSPALQPRSDLNVIPHTTDFTSFNAANEPNIQPPSNQASQYAPNHDRLPPMIDPSQGLEANIARIPDTRPIPKPVPAGQFVRSVGADNTVGFSNVRPVPVTRTEQSSVKPLSDTLPAGYGAQVANNSTARYVQHTPLVDLTAAPRAKQNKLQNRGRERPPYGMNSSHTEVLPNGFSNNKQHRPCDVN